MVRAMDDLEIQAIRHMYHSDPASFFSLAFRLLYPGLEYLPHDVATKKLAALAEAARGGVPA